MQWGATDPERMYDAWRLCTRRRGSARSTAERGHARATRERGTGLFSFANHGRPGAERHNRTREERVQRGATDPERM